MNEVIYNALCACFDLAPSSAAASVLIREAYQDPEPAPRPPRSMNVIYYSLETDPQAAVCYGPDALENARRIRAFLYLDGAGMPRFILRQAGIRPVPYPPEPLALHEPEGSLWRLRADLTVSLRAEEKQTHSRRRNAVTLAPEVYIHY